MLLLLLACTSTSPLLDSGSLPDGGTQDGGAQDSGTADGVHGRLTDVDGQPVLYLWGSRYDMGYAEGSLTCDHVSELFVKYLLEELIEQHTSYTYEVARGFVLGATSFEQGDLDELQGYYEGALDHCTTEQLTVTSPLLEDDSGGSRLLELEDLYFANALADFGCSSFTAWGSATATGDTLHARNFDWAVDEDGVFLDQHLVKVYDSQEEGARFLSVMVPGMLGCVSCVTEEGVSLTMHNVGGLPTTTATGISPRMFGARAALAATVGADDVVAAAEAVLEARPQNTGNNLHLAWPLSRSIDGTGAAVFEYDGDADHADGRVTVRTPGQDPLLGRPDGIVATNHYIVRSEPPTSGDSADRSDKLRTALEQGGPTGHIDRLAARQMLQSVENNSSGLTVHSVVIDAGARTMDLYVAPDAETSAVEDSAVSLDLDELFAGLPSD